MDMDVFPSYQAAVRRDVQRGFLVEFKDYCDIAAQQAKAAIAGSHKAVEGGIPVGVRRGNQMTGLFRYFLTDEGFEQLVARHGGEFIRQVKVNSSSGIKDAPLHLTTAKFGATLVGFASHFGAEDLPSKNATRIALCAQNIGLGPDLVAGPELYVDRERFVLIMIRRDRFDIGKIGAITIAITDPKISQFLMQVNINDFLASYGEPKRAPSTGTFSLKKDAPRLRGPDVGIAKEQKS